jgi:hypothetical protein
MKRAFAVALLLVSLTSAALADGFGKPPGSQGTSQPPLFTSLR